MRATRGLFDDAIDDLQRESRSGAVIFMRAAASSAFDPSFQRIDAQPSGEMTLYTPYSSTCTRLATARANAPPLPPSPTIVAMIGTRRFRHRREACANRFALPALFGADAGIRARCVDERQDRQAKAIGELVEPARFAIPFGLRLSKVTCRFLFRRAPFLMPDDDDAASVEARQTADDRRIIGKSPIAVQLLPIGEQMLDIIERVRPIRMP